MCILPRTTPTLFEASSTVNRCINEPPPWCSTSWESSHAVRSVLLVCALQAYDQHLNMILGEVEETITTVEIDDETYEEIIKVSDVCQQWNSNERVGLVCSTPDIQQHCTVQHSNGSVTQLKQHN